MSEKDLYDKYDYVSRVYCVKAYKTIVPGRSYQIKGRGNLEFNADPEVNGRKGYGLCIEDEWINSDKPRWWNLPYKDRIKWYYFTLKEMEEYFITEDEYYKSYHRDQLLTSLGIK